MRILITGVNGFVGRHLVRELKSRGHEVVGLGNDGLATEMKDLVDRYERCDLTNAEQVAKLPLENINAVINLAGLASIGASFTDPDKYKHVNVAVLSVLGERLLEIDSRTRVVAISSAAVYSPDQTLPLTEESKTVTEESSPYASSKLAMEDAGRKLRRKGLDCVIVRSFNHSGPGQKPGFLIPDLYTKIVEAKKTGQIIKAGNLKTKRDYTDVRDVVRAYADLAASETLAFDTYNVCSGKSRSGEEVLEVFLRQMNLENKIQIKVDPSLIRPNDTPDHYGNHDRLTEETGWKPEISFEQTITDFISSKKVYLPE